MQTLSIFPECSISISSIEDGPIHSYEDLSALPLKTRMDQLVYLPTHKHATGIKTITKENKDQVMFDADIVLTDQKGAHIAHQFADCVPLVFLDRQRKTFCFAHLGWRGLVTGGVHVCILAMQANFGSRPEDLWTWIGPCIRKESYVVPEKPMQASLTSWGPFLSDVRVGDEIHWSIDLPGFIQAQCATFGIDPERIIDDGRDTYRESEIFFSHQRYGASQDEKAKGNFIVAVSLI